MDCICSCISTYGNESTEIENIQPDAPDSSYTCETIAWIITGVALLALAAVAAGILTTISPVLAVSAFLILAGLGIISASYAAETHFKVMAERELDFAHHTDDEEVKLKYFRKAAVKGNSEAMSYFYGTAKKRVLKELENLSDDFNDDQKIRQALARFELSADYAVGNGGLVIEMLESAHYDIALLLKETKDPKIQDILLQKYWIKLVNTASTQSHQATIHWKPLILLNEK